MIYKPRRIAITSGDIDGIGFEVTAKALSRVKPQRGVQFYLWRSPKASKKFLKLIDRHFKRLTLKDWPSALKASSDFHKTIIDIESPTPPAKWVETMAHAGHSRSIDALVTAPLSKTGIVQSGLKDNGHTDILKRVTRTPHVFMCFLGKEFNVVLLTGHLSLKRAYEKIDGDLIGICAQLTHKMKKNLSAKSKTRPIALVGCNPHCGEQGIIDKKEDLVYLPTLKKLKNKRISIEGPLVPDVCFQKPYWKKYSFYLASYHDQGLIPFKMVHGANSGVQLSLGLPFLRTSVDHGTAKDIFAKNKADSGSMEQAIKVALRLLKNKPIVW